MKFQIKACWFASVASLFLLPASARLVHAQSQGQMVPFSMDHRRAAQLKSPVDVSFLLDAPAGKHGFLEVQEGHLATGDGKRIRLWGVNITDWSKGSRQIPSKEDAAFWASTLARFGVNSVRLQFLDLKTPRGLIQSGVGNTRSLDAEQFDREDYFIAELEKRGIYIDFNLVVGRPFEEGDGVKDARLLHEGAKGTSFYDARLIELQKEYAKQLLDHLNPYTRRKYTADPGVAIVEINNENAINVGFHAPSPFYENELQSIYNQWLSRHMDATQLAKLRTLAAVAPGASVPLMSRRGESSQAPPERFHTEASFYNDLQHDYFADMEQFIQQTLGSKSLIIATADHSHAGSGYPILLAMNNIGIIDGHTYWQHPESYVRKSPMVNDPFNSTVAELSRSAVAGKPYTVSEVNNPFPNDYAGEGIPILAAYGNLQDWDAIMWYTFEPKSDPAWKPYVGDPFDISLDPLKMPELAAGALMFLRGDIQKAKTTVARSYSQQQVYDSMLLPTTERPYFTPGFPPHLALEHEVRIASLTDDPTKSVPAEAIPDSNVPDPLVSDTGQLSWYWQQHLSAKQDGMVAIDTPRTQALIGFLNAHDQAHDQVHDQVRAQALANVSVSTANSFSTILLTSMEDQPIASSSHLLLVAGGAVQNNGQTWNVVGTDVTAWGQSPTLIDVVKGSVTLRNLGHVQSVTIAAIDGAGQPIGTPAPAIRTGENWQMSIGDVPTTWYEISIVR